MSGTSLQPIKLVERLYCLSVLLLLQVVLLQGVPSGLSVNRYSHSHYTLKASSNSDIWSGYEVQGPLGTFQAAQGTFTIPSLSPSVPGIVSLWVGIGGETQAPLVQAGVDVSMNSRQQSAMAWTEVNLIDDSNPVNDVKFVKGFHPGDLITVFISSSVNSSIVTFTIQNITTKESHTSSQNGKQYLSDGTTGECILEQLSGAKGPEPVANFGVVKFSNCSIARKGSALRPIKSYQGLTKLDLVQNGRKLTRTEDFDAQGQAFTITWLHS